jgi:hypothetical protein
MRVDQAGADRDAGYEPEIGGGLRPQGPDALPELGRGRRDAHAREQIVEPDTRQQILGPAHTLVVEVAPFAGDGARRHGDDAGRAPRQIVREIERHASARPGLRQMALEPQELGQLHLRRHRAADIVEHAMTGGVDLRRFRRCTVVRPHDDVPAVGARRRDGDRPAVRVEHHQRTGRVEGDAGDRARVELRLGEYRAHRDAHRLPDLRCVVLAMVGRRPADVERRRRRREHPPVAIERPRASTGRSNVDGEEDGGVRHARTPSTDAFHR